MAETHPRHHISCCDCEFEKRFVDRRTAQLRKADHALETGHTVGYAETASDERAETAEDGVA